MLEWPPHPPRLLLGQKIPAPPGSISISVQTPSFSLFRTNQTSWADDARLPEEHPMSHTLCSFECLFSCAGFPQTTFSHYLTLPVRHQATRKPRAGYLHRLHVGRGGSLLQLGFWVLQIDTPMLHLESGQVAPGLPILPVLEHGCHGELGIGIRDGVRERNRTEGMTLGRLG